MIEHFAEILRKAINDPVVIVGFIGQAVFMSRFVVQWVASERARRSVIPIAFWYLSLLGSALLLAYAVYVQDPVFVVGQLFGFVVYIRNLFLIYAHKSAQGKAT
jgi:lipid-A-disaccharide synthase-like uncharacterized protein